MKDELGCKLMIWFAALKPKTYRYLRHDKNGNKKVKGTKKRAIK